MSDVIRKTQKEIPAYSFSLHIRISKKNKSPWKLFSRSEGEIITCEKA